MIYCWLVLIPTYIWPHLWWHYIPFLPWTLHSPRTMLLMTFPYGVQMKALPVCWRDGVLFILGVGIFIVVIYCRDGVGIWLRFGAGCCCCCYSPLFLWPVLTWPSPYGDVSLHSTLRPLFPTMLARCVVDDITVLITFWFTLHVTLPPFTVPPICIPHDLPVMLLNNLTHSIYCSLFGRCYLIRCCWFVMVIVDSFYILRMLLIPSGDCWCCYSFIIDAVVDDDLFPGIVDIYRFGRPVTGGIGDTIYRCGIVDDPLTLLWWWYLTLLFIRWYDPYWCSW